MTEKTILLQIADPMQLYGLKDANLELLKRYFCKLKVIARGETIKLIGNNDDIDLFEIKISQICDYINKFNNINDKTIVEILNLNQEEFENTFKKPNDILLYSNKGKPIKARTKNQKKLVDASYYNDLLFAIGPAGTGKTYTAIALAVKALKEGKVQKIILSRPAVEAGENIGFLPGDLREKLDPYLQPLYDALLDMLPYQKLEKLITEKIIQIAPLGFMRGRTLSNAYVILDEAQNSTTKQMKMFLTRMGENSTFIVTGDITQIDLPNSVNSGLKEAPQILTDVEGVAIINLTSVDIIRHELVSKIVNAYDINNK